MLLVKIDEGGRRLFRRVLRLLYMGSTGAGAGGADGMSVCVCLCVYLCVSGRYVLPLLRIHRV